LSASCTARPSVLLASDVLKLTQEQSAVLIVKGQTNGSLKNHLNLDP